MNPRPLPYLLDLLPILFLLDIILSINTALHSLHRLLQLPNPLPHSPPNLIPNPLSPLTSLRKHLLQPIQLVPRRLAIILGVHGILLRLLERDLVLVAGRGVLVLDLLEDLVRLGLRAVPSRRGWCKDVSVVVQGGNKIGCVVGFEAGEEEGREGSGGAGEPETAGADRRSR